MDFLEFTSKEVVAHLMLVAAPLWLGKFWEKIKILDFFCNILKIMEKLKNCEV